MIYTTQLIINKSRSKNSNKNAWGEPELKSLNKRLYLPWYDLIVVKLQGSDPARRKMTRVAFQRSDQLACFHIPNFDVFIAAGDYVLVVKLDRG